MQLSNNTVTSTLASHKYLGKVLHVWVPALPAAQNCHDTITTADPSTLYITPPTAAFAYQVWISSAELAGMATYPRRLSRHLHINVLPTIRSGSLAGGCCNPPPLMPSNHSTSCKTGLQEQQLQHSQQPEGHRVPSVPRSASQQQWDQHQWQQQQQQPHKDGITVQTTSQPYQQRQQQQLSTPGADKPSQRIACVFLDQATNSCTVHPVRPLQCSSYPWWPELMPQQHWQQEKGVLVVCCQAGQHYHAPGLMPAIEARFRMLAIC